MNNDERLTQLHEWIGEALGTLEFTLIPVSGDASFRRYFRFTFDKQNFVAVDAPPDKENNEAFIKITHLLEAEGLPVPHIYYSSLDSGFFIIKDFGDTLLLHALDSGNVAENYRKAFENLTVIQRTPASGLPKYDEKLLLQEMELFREWFLQKHLGLNLNTKEKNILDQTYAILMENALQQPQVFVHRDYHSRNLMLIESDGLGIIDYQDAVLGPITYDLVSLLRDCYVAWPAKQVEDWALNFHTQLLEDEILAENDELKFLKWFDLMGIQRHLKAIGIFARLNIRDNKPGYLHDIPRTLRYVQEIASKYLEIKNFSEFINNKVSI